MEGNNQPSAPRSEIPFAWAPGWNSPQAWNKFQAEVGGHLRHGDPGIRLLDSPATAKNSWYTEIPTAFSTSTTLRIAPLWRLFGSEELSQRSAVFQQRMSPGQIVLHPKDAEQLGLTGKSRLELRCQGLALTLPIQLSAQLAQGHIGLPVGLPGVPLWLINATIDSIQEVE